MRFPIDCVRHVVLCSVVGLIVCGGVSAQRTWVVDDHGGPGVHFTDLPAAFAVVSHSDVVLVRPGTYRPARLDKPIRLLGDPGAVVALAQEDLEITAIPAQSTCVIRGLTLQQNTPFLPRGRLHVHDCDGVVVLALEYESSCRWPLRRFLRNGVGESCLKRRRCAPRWAPKTAPSPRRDALSMRKAVSGLPR